MVLPDTAQNGHREFVLYELWPAMVSLTSFLGGTYLIGCQEATKGCCLAKYVKIALQDAAAYQSAMLVNTLDVSQEKELEAQLQDVNNAKQ